MGWTRSDLASSGAAARAGESAGRTAQREMDYYLASAGLVTALAVLVAVIIYTRERNHLTGWDFAIAIVGAAAALIAGGRHVFKPQAAGGVRAMLWRVVCSLESRPDDMRRVPLSSHPCLTSSSGTLTGPGPSLRTRFAARPSSVLRPDPSP